MQLIINEQSYQLSELDKSLTKVINTHLPLEGRVVSVQGEV